MIPGGAEEEIFKADNTYTISDLINFIYEVSDDDSDKETESQGPQVVKR